MDEGYGTELTTKELDKIGQDPFLVAYAYAKPKRTVVTKVISFPVKLQEWVEGDRTTKSHVIPPKVHLLAKHGNEVIDLHLKVLI